MRHPSGPRTWPQLGGTDVDATQIAALHDRRRKLAAMIDAMRATPEADRPSKKADRRAWDQELASCEELLKQLDEMLKRMSPPAGPAPAQSATVGTADGYTVAVVGRIRKGWGAEIRVVVRVWKGRRIIDVRVWSPRDGGKEAVPSRKGVTVDASMLDALIDSLHRARQHV